MSTIGVTIPSEIRVALLGSVTVVLGFSLTSKSKRVANPLDMNVPVAPLSTSAMILYPAIITGRYSKCSLRLWDAHNYSMSYVPKPTPKYPKQSFPDPPRFASLKGLTVASLQGLTVASLKGYTYDLTLDFNFLSTSGDMVPNTPRLILDLMIASAV